MSGYAKYYRKIELVVDGRSLCSKVINYWTEESVIKQLKKLAESRTVLEYQIFVHRKSRMGSGRIGRAKIKKDQYDDVYRKKTRGYTTQFLAAEYRVSGRLINLICQSCREKENLTY